MTPTDVRDGMETVTLDQTIEQAALLSRMDTKYLLEESEVTTLLQQSACHFRVLEIDGLREFRYLSTYLDSPTLDLFRWHVQGRRRRAKCRIREYVDSGDRQLEVKVKGQRGQTVKYRQPCALSPKPAECGEFLAACLREAYDLAAPSTVIPSLEVEYLRMTLVSTDFSERVTLDHALSFTDVSSGIRTQLPPSMWIVETKNASGSGRADAALRDAGHRPANVSKYVLGISLTRDAAPVNDYRALIRRLGAVAA